MSGYRRVAVYPISEAESLTTRATSGYNYVNEKGLKDLAGLISWINLDDVRQVLPFQTSKKCFSDIIFKDNTKIRCFSWKSPIETGEPNNTPNGQAFWENFGLEIVDFSLVGLSSNTTNRYGNTLGVEDLIND